MAKMSLGSSSTGQPVDGRQRRTGEHVAGTRTDGRGHREGLQPVQLPGVADGDVHHGLLVAALVVRQFAGRHQFGLQQRLTEPGDVAVPEDPEAAGEELAFHAVSLGVLLAEEFHDGLGDGQPDGGGAPCRAGGAARAVHRSPSSDSND